MAQFRPSSVPPAAAAPTLQLHDWRAADAYVGAPPELRWLVTGSIPLGVPTLLAAAGGIGKSTLLLNLCRMVASGAPDARIFGGPVAATGAAVMLTGEDGRDTIHRRLALRRHLRPDGSLAELPGNLYVVPLPDAGGPFPIVSGNKFDGLTTTDAFDDLLDQLVRIADLRVVVLDPLQMFALCDFNSDPAAAQFTCSVLARLAAATKASVIAAHHFRKPTSGTITSAADARNAIRGTTGLVDGVRCAYALWPSDDPVDTELCRRSAAFAPLIRGAVVKANEVSTTLLHAYLRRHDGSLEDVTEFANQMAADLRRHGVTTHQLEQIVDAIAAQAEAGRPLTRTGGNGVHARRECLPVFAHAIGKHRLIEIVDDLLTQNLLVQAMAAGSKQAHWLDVPNGPFARGAGTFQTGAGDPNPVPGSFMPTGNGKCRERKKPARPNG